MAVEPLHLAVILFSGAIGWLGAMLVTRYAYRWQLVQAPNHRSSHVRPTPHGGGLGIAVAGLLAALLLAQGGNSELVWMALLGLALALVGLRDDLTHLSARTRLLIQMLVCALLLALLGDWQLTVASVALLLVLIVGGAWWINLFNFMDGIDGLAGSQAICMLLAGCVLALLSSPPSATAGVWLWALAIAAATSGFLLLNWPPARIFMGDVGSTYLAFVIFAVALCSVVNGWLEWVVWLILGAVFITDASVTLLRRLIFKQAWTQPHRSHAYQRLARRWSSHRAVTLAALAVNLLWLMPLAMAVSVWPKYSTPLLMAAYVPLLVAVLGVGAGSTDNA